jgi:hypothetical protein
MLLSKIAYRVITDLICAALRAGLWVTIILGSRIYKDVPPAPGLRSNFH